MVAPNDPNFDPFSAQYAGRDQAMAQKSLAMGKQNVKVLEHAQRELSKLSRLAAGGSLSLMAAGDVKRLDREFKEVTIKIERAGKALNKAFSTDNAQGIGKYGKELKKLEARLENIAGETSEITRTSTKLGAVQGVLANKWARVTSGAMAAGFAFKALQGASEGAQFAIGDLISQGKSIPKGGEIITDLFGTEIGTGIGAAADKTWEYITVQHKLAFAAARTGRSLTDMSDAAANIQFRLHPKSMKELVKYTEQTSMLARFLKIDMGQAIDFIVERQRRFGNSMEHSTKTLGFMVSLVHDANDAFGSGTIEVDEFSDMMMEASRSASSYAQNLRALSKMIRNHIVDVQLQGGSYREAMDSAKALLGVIQNAPKHLQFMAGADLLGQTRNMGKKELEGFFSDLKGDAKKQVVAGVMDIQSKLKSGVMTEAGAQENIHALAAESFQGIKATLKTLETAKNVKGLQELGGFENVNIARLMMTALTAMKEGGLREWFNRTRGAPTEFDPGGGGGSMKNTALDLTKADKGRINAIEAAHTALIDKLGEQMTGLQLLDVAHQLTRAEGLISNPLIAGGMAAVTGLLALGLGGKIVAWMTSVRALTTATWASVGLKAGPGAGVVKMVATAVGMGVSGIAAVVAGVVAAPVVMVAAAYGVQKIIDADPALKKYIRNDPYSESYYTQQDMNEVNNPLFLNNVMPQATVPQERLWNKYDFVKYQRDAEENARTTSRLREDGSVLITKTYVIPEFSALVADATKRTNANIN